LSAVAIVVTEATVLNGVRLHSLISCVSGTVFVECTDTGKHKNPPLCLNELERAKFNKHFAILSMRLKDQPTSDETLSNFSVGS